MDPVQEKRLKLALKAGRFGTWELDLSNLDLTSSDQCKANYGRSPSDVFTYENLNDSVHPEDRHRLQAAVQIGLNGGREFSLEYRCIWPDGSLHWIEVNGLVSLGADGKPEKMNGVTQEITGRKSIESELSAAKSTITSMLDTVNIATWTVNLSNNVLTADRNMARMFFFGEERLERPIDDYFEMIHPEDLPKVKAAMAEVFDDPSKGYKIEYRLLSPTKQVRWIDVRGTVERDQAGKAVMFRGVILDVTERKTAEELQLRLAVSQRLLALQEEERRRLGRELHDSAGQIIAALSMDISSIARKSKANAAVLEQTDQCREMLDKLSKEIRTTSYLLHPPLLDELGLASALGWYVDGLNARSGLRITLEVPEAIPRLESNLELTAFKVVQECLTNVYRHSGSETACVAVTVEGGKLTVIVADKGKGIAAAKSLSGRTQGSGVGMLGMRERLREVDGTMDIRSNEPGTRIRFDFPLALAH